MSKCKKLFCLLFAALMVLTSISASFCAAAEDAVPTAAVPLTVQAEMSRSSYFVTAKAKATVTVRNTGAEKLKDVAVSAFSEKHLLPEGSESCLLIPELEAGQSMTYAFEMVLNRKSAGVSFFERVCLFFVQLFRSYEPMQGIPRLPDLTSGTEFTVHTQEVTFRHGSANAVLEIDARYHKDADPVDPLDPVDPHPRPQVTYLDKYVIEIFKSGAYSLAMELKQDDGKILPVTLYENEDNMAIEMTLTDLVLKDLQPPATLANAGKVRFILKDKNTANPKAFVAWTGGYIETENAKEVADAIRNQLPMTLADIAEDLKYCGMTTGVGYICETYKNAEENELLNFYFARTEGYEGVVRMDVIDMTTNAVSSQTILRLTQGVTNSNAFTVSGKKYDVSELEGFGG